MAVSTTSYTMDTVRTMRNKVNALVASGVDWDEAERRVFWPGLHITEYREMMKAFEDLFTIEGVGRAMNGI